MAASVRYEVEGWGVGELWLDGETLLWHELPSRSATEGSDDSPSELAVRLRSYLALLDSLCIFEPSVGSTGAVGRSLWKLP